MIINGNNIEELKKFDDNYFDSIVTDPPYEIGFMGKSWDASGIANNPEMWSECLRVLKPGGYLLSFSATRTYHRMTCAIEDSGFEIRDMIEWVYGSGFPKSLNIGKAVDKLQRGNKTVELIDALLEEGKTLKELGEMAGIPSLESSYRDWTTGGHKPEERSWERMLNGLGFSEAYGLNIIEKRIVSLGGGNAYTFREGEKRDWEIKITKGTSEFEGKGTALKPAHEPICMARKPLAEKTVAENVLKYGTGGINIDESRVGTEENTSRTNGKTAIWADKGMNSEQGGGHSQGRFPANLIHDNSEEVRECFPETKSGKAVVGTGKGYAENASGIASTGIIASCFADSGNASRFFKSIIYQAKASKSERNKGCEGLEDVIEHGHYAQDEWSRNNMGNTPDAKREPTKNNHPTVKPVALMEYLIKMVTPTNGIVLDPFMGSGSTGVACVLNDFKFVGIDLDKDYCEIARARIEGVKETQTKLF